MNNYIIGGGVAGLTLAFLDESFKVIDANPMGQINSKYQLGPRLIQESESTQEFLLKFLEKHPVAHIKVKTAKIGYEDENGFVLDWANDIFKRKYSLLTRGTEEYEPTFLSEGKNEIEHYIFEGLSNDSYAYLFKTILSILESRNQIIKNTVESIDAESKMISMDGYKQFSYDNLVNTVSLKILKKLLKDSSELNSIDLTTKNKNFYVVDKPPIERNFDYIYSIQGKFTRITFFDDYVVYESEQAYPELKAIYGYEIVYRMENLPIQIVKSANIENISGIHMLGRYAQWSHKVKLGEVIEQSEKIIRRIYG